MSGGNTSLVDGRTNNTAIVDASGRLATRAVAFTSTLEASIKGEHYEILPVTFPVLTNDVETAVLYLRNSEPAVTTWAVNFFTLTAGVSDGTGAMAFRTVFNPTAGNLLTGGTAANIVQLNLGISRDLATTANTGGTGDTLTGEAASFNRLIPGVPAGLSFPLDAIIMPAGSSIGIMVTPPSGNTSMSIDISVSVIRLTEV